MGAPLLPALLLAASWAWTQSPDEAKPQATVVQDLSGKFVAECRAQGDTGSCHAFASVALLEAAMPEPVRLSVADLFVRAALAEGLYNLVKNGDGSLAIEVEEGGTPAKDLPFAIENGLAEAEAAPWKEFLDAYKKYRAAHHARCAELVKGAGGKVKECLRDEESALREYLDEFKGPAAREKRERLLGDPKTLEASRGRVKPKLRGLVHRYKSRKSGDFDQASVQDAGDKDICREKGRKQTEVLVALLDADTPAVVCFNMENLPGWDKSMKKKSGDRHCVALDGYSVRGKGQAARKIFSTRNSWGSYVAFETPVPAHPDIKIPRFVPITHELGEDQACAINEAHWVTR